MSVITNTDAVQEILKQRLSDMMLDDLPAILTEHDAIIAGGFVLNAILHSHNNSGFTNTDIDIYVNRRNAINLLKRLQEQHNYMISVIGASPYDLSFFYKNHILARFYLFVIDAFVPQPYSIDVMIVDDDTDVETVAQNFDLSFCEAWYNGLLVQASNEEHIVNKKGILKNDYVNALVVYKNGFIIRRIKKYIERGFDISYTYDNTEDIELQLSEKNLIEDTEEIWLMRMYRQFLHGFGIINNDNFIESLEYKNFADFYEYVEAYGNQEKYTFEDMTTEIYEHLSDDKYKSIMRNVLGLHGIII